MIFRLRIGIAALALLGALVFSTPGFAGGEVAFTGGSAAQRSQVSQALRASSFDWSLLRDRVTVHIGQDFASEARPGEVWLNGRLLDSGRFSWAVVQHEFAHQVDYQLLSSETRAHFGQLLGGKDWCYEVPGLAHGEYGCERFASTLSWAYWPKADNGMKPASATDEAGAMKPAAFRAELARALGQPALRNLRR